MNTPEQILHNRVNLFRLVRRLDKSVNELDWGSEKNTTLWLRSEGLLQVGPFFSDCLAVQ
jgi:SNARE protein 1